MEEREAKWLVEIFLQYQEQLDAHRKVTGDRQWLKDALESDRKNKTWPRNTASVIDSI